MNLKVVDSSGWLHYFMNGPLAEPYAKILEGRLQSIVTPTVVLYEVYRRVKQKLGDDIASSCAAEMEKTRVFGLSSDIAYRAADLSIEHKLATADALIYASAASLRLKLITSDSDFRNLPNVEYIPAEG